VDATLTRKKLDASVKIDSSANDILRVSFDYRNFEMSKKSILGGASFQSVLLQSHPTQIENIGIAIYQMNKFYAGLNYFAAILNILLTFLFVFSTIFRRNSERY